MFSARHLGIFVICLLLSLLTDETFDIFQLELDRAFDNYSNPMMIWIIQIIILHAFQNMSYQVEENTMIQLII